MSGFAFNRRQELDEATVERVARAICIDHTIDLRRAQDFARTAVTAYLSEMPPRLSPELIAKLNALASRLTQMGEYDACDLIDTVVERVSAMPQRELLAEALDALTPFAVGARSIDVDPPGDHEPSHGRGSVTAGDLRRARAAADKIRAALTQEKQT